jgi:3'-phosphoadenosine 5'-phosphosulfate sulfotransferase (PAPS reductase)/FAD synthetase
MNGAAFGGPLLAKKALFQDGSVRDKPLRRVSDDTQHKFPETESWRRRAADAARLQGIAPADR